MVDYTIHHKMDYKMVVQHILITLLSIGLQRVKMIIRILYIILDQKH